MRAVGCCGWALAGSLAAFGIWDFGGFSVLLNSEPNRPAAIQGPLRPGNFRPAAERNAGCTQAPIDRASGQTTPTDCQASAPGAETLTAQLAEPASPQ